MQHDPPLSPQQPTAATASQRLSDEANAQTEDAGSRRTGWITASCDALQQHEHIR